MKKSISALALALVAAGATAGMASPAEAADNVKVLSPDLGAPVSPGGQESLSLCLFAFNDPSSWQWWIDNCMLDW